MKCGKINTAMTGCNCSACIAALRAELAETQRILRNIQECQHYEKLCHQCREEVDAALREGRQPVPLQINCEIDPYGRAIVTQPAARSDGQQQKGKV